MNLKLFDKTLIKLTVLYLAIIMAISLFFSLSLYRASVSELNRGLMGPSIVIQKLPKKMSGFPDFRSQLLEERSNNFEDARNRIISELLMINLFILVGGGLLSYFLAKKTLQPIEKAHEAQKRFTADASHELRTPIAAMQSGIEVTLMDPKLNLAKAREQLDSNLEELAKLTNLSENLLKLSKLGSNNLKKSECSLNEIVQQAISQLLPLAENKKILLEPKIKEDINICADMDSIKDGLVILIDNAIKYSPKKSVVTISAAKSQNAVMIKVTDKGVGIKNEDLPHIFERFYRSDSARSKDKIAGYGLGLSIAKQIVEAHGGNISAHSKEGKGSTFVIKLPIK